MIGGIFYLCLNAFRVYIIYRFIGLFFEKSMQKRSTVYGYAIYYIVNSVGYLFLNNDKVTLLINVGGLLFITILCYRGNVARKFLAFIASYGMALLTENIAWLVFVKNKGDEMFEFGFFFAVFILFLAEIIIERTINLCKGVELSIANAIILTLISVGSMFIANILIESFSYHFLLLVIAVCILLAINIAVFYLYEKLLDDYLEQKNEEMYRLQLIMYENQLQLMKNANEAYSSMRHDMKHHTILLKDYIEKGEKNKAIQYIDKINDYANPGKQYVGTGNDGIDSIFNYIITEVNKIEGVIETEIKIPEDFEIDEFDINIILSNLLMNSYEAVKKSQRKEIRAVMRYDKGTLKIQISNTYDGVVKKKANQFISTKQESGEHGIGLASVKKIVNKYKGDMEINYTEEKFEVNILLYL